MVTLHNPPSDREDASSAQEVQLDEIELVQQLHYQLECLPPADTGKHAYLFLLACFILEALVWGKCSPSHWHETLP
jgi:hypothetical protein